LRFQINQIRKKRRIESVKSSSLKANTGAQCCIVTVGLGYSETRTARKALLTRLK
jgi:hypothetical protein